MFFSNCDLKVDSVGSRDSACFLCGCIERHFAALAISHP